MFYDQHIKCVGEIFGYRALRGLQQSDNLKWHCVHLGQPFDAVSKNDIKWDLKIY
jgi:hypothetical protein